MTVIMQNVVFASVTNGVVVEGIPVRYNLSVKSGTIKIDDSWSPFVQASVVLAPPSNAAASLLRSIRTSPIRISVTGQTKRPDGTLVSAQTFDLTARSYERNWKTGEYTVTAESDEALLDDYRPYPAATDDYAAYAYQSSLANLVNFVLAKIGATLEPGYFPRSVEAKPSSVNLFSNPSLETTGTGWGQTNCAIAIETTWGAPGAGSRSLRIQSPTSADSFAFLDGDAGAMRNGMQAGKTYTVSATFRMVGAQSGSIGTNARRAVAYWKEAGASTYSASFGTQAPNAAGTTRLVNVFTIPEGATEAFIRFYHGATAGTVYWDAVRLSEGNGALINDTGYFDGSTTTDSNYQYGWNDAVGTSVSYRLAVHGRDPGVLIWKPGVSAWDFVQDVVESTGSQLLCDVDRKWYLREPGMAFPGGPVTVSAGVNTIEMTDSMDLDDDTFYTAVIVVYRWTDQATNTERTYIDRADDGTGAPYRVRYVEVTHAPTGPSLAKRILIRARGLAAVMQIEAPTDYRAKASQGLDVIQEVGGITQNLRVASVAFNLADGTMQIDSRSAEAGNSIAL